MNYFSDKGLNVSTTPDGDLKIQGLSSLQDDLKRQVLQYAKKNKWRIAFEIQTLGKTLQQKIDILWNTAEVLADWMDDETDIPWEERAAKIPELQKMAKEIDRLIAQQKKSSSFNRGSREVVEPEKKDTCPAQCKTTGKCYGRAYFDAKPGPATVCMPDQCEWRN